MAMVCQTERLLLRHLELGDAPFILRLLNEPSFIEFIADRNVHSLDDARAYLEAGPLTMVRRTGLGLLLVEERASGLSIGLHGLLQRETLPVPDLGYAFVPEAWGKGYATEAGHGVLDWARKSLPHPRIAAITSVANPKSIAVLSRLGFQFVKIMPWNNGTEEVRYFEVQLQAH